MEKMIIANWKMNLGIRESLALAKTVLLALQGKEIAPRVVLCPSFLALADVHKVIARSRVALGAQDVGPDRFGAYTGAVGVGHLEDVGCSYVLLGHSERRMVFGETDELIRRKITAVAHGKGVQAVVCVGESVDDHASGDAVQAVVRILRRSLAAAELPKSSPLPIIAYEPVWAIGSGVQPAVPEVLAIVRALRETMEELFPQRATYPVLYGGSVNAENAYAFLREPEIDGVLVGGASLKVQEFQGILSAACEVMNYQSSS
ncbi:MAG: triose-phosphate isomerase [Patescibacteria group bacterium]